MKIIISWNIVLKWSQRSACGVWYELSMVKPFLPFLIHFMSCSIGVAQCTISEEQKKKDRLNLQYILTIEQFIDLLKSKTNYIEKEYDKTDEHLTHIDNQCQSYFDAYKESSEQITSSDAMTKFCEQLDELKMNF